MTTTSNNSSLLRSGQAVVNGGGKVVVGPKSTSIENEIKINRGTDGIESIEVACKCGQTIVIRCEYE